MKVQQLQRNNLPHCLYWEWMRHVSPPFWTHCSCVAPVLTPPPLLKWLSQPTLCSCEPAVSRPMGASEDPVSQFPPMADIVPLLTHCSLPLGFPSSLYPGGSSCASQCPPEVLFLLRDVCSPLKSWRSLRDYPCSFSQAAHLPANSQACLFSGDRLRPNASQTQTFLKVQMHMMSQLDTALV